MIRAFHKETGLSKAFLIFPDITRQEVGEK